MFSRMMPLSYNCLNWRKRFCVKLILWLRNLKFIYAVKEWLLCKEDLARFKSADSFCMNVSTSVVLSQDKLWSTSILLYSFFRSDMLILASLTRTYACSWLSPSAAADGLRGRPHLTPAPPTGALSPSLGAKGVFLCSPPFHAASGR